MGGEGEAEGEPLVMHFVCHSSSETVSWLHNLYHVEIH